MVKKKACIKFQKVNYWKGLPSNKEKLLIAWIEIHKDELMADWSLASTGQKIFTIDPLK